MKEKISISIEDQWLKQLDVLIGKEGIRNRSQAIEFVIQKHFKQEGNLKAVLVGSNLSKKKLQHLPNLLRRLREAGVDELIIAGFNDSELIYEELRKDDYFFPRSTFLKETSPAGTAGVLKLAAHYLVANPFIVCYLDVDIDLDVRALVTFHRQNKSVATMAVVHVEKGLLTDYIRISGNRISEFEYKSGRTTKLQNAGVYVFEPIILEEIPSKGSLELDCLSGLAREGRLLAFFFDTAWTHLGN
jgi:NDP-sugar pyrophosphorylase family protein